VGEFNPPHLYEEQNGTPFFPGSDSPPPLPNNGGWRMIALV